MDKGYVQNTIFELLSRLGIGYEKLEHSPIITMKEGSEIAYKLGSTSCKNLFLCNKRQEYFMLMLPADKKLSAKNVARQIGSPHLSFASAEDMERLLHTYPGAVSVLSLIYDKEKRVQLLIDKGLMNVTYIGCHPCTNTCSLKIKMENLYASCSKTKSVPAEWNLVYHTIWSTVSRSPVLVWECAVWGLSLVTAWKLFANRTPSCVKNSNWQAWTRKYGNISP